MDLIIDFYKGLDTINLIIFWGIIIVILLLLIFAIIIVNKNKRLKQIIISKEQEIDVAKNELAIKDEHITIVEKRLIDTQIQNNKAPKVTIEKKKEEKKVVNNVVNNVVNEEIPIQNNIPVPEEKFIVEEHVKENNEDLTPTIPEIEVNEDIDNEKNVNVTIQKTNVVIPTEPYQRNVLREMSLEQTSPIGIIKKGEEKKVEIEKTEELNSALNNPETPIEPVKRDNYENNYQREMNSSKEKIVKLYENRENYNPKTTQEKIEPSTEPVKDNDTYLEEVSKKLEKATEPEKIERTAYEIKQEEEAIISYEELMKKKDSLKMVDEEDAVISIEELINKKNEEDRLYNITKEEEDNTFISELKHFRSDL